MSVRRLSVVAAITAVAIPFSIAFAGSASAAESPLDAISSITDITGDLPLLGDATKGSPVDGLTGGLPVAGDPLSTVTGLLEEGGITDVVTGLPVAGPLVDSLGVTEVVDGLLGTVTGTVGGITGGGLLGGGKVETGHKGNSKPSVKFEETSLPHTGGDADLTALLMCAGLAAAGTGVTLVTRRRRAGI
ncbi:MAG: hypothetical protein ACT4QG_22900 [Sporichthyaceae bacterium]